VKVEPTKPAQPLASTDATTVENKA